MFETNEIAKVLLSKEEIEEIVARLGAEITEDYKDKNLLVVSVLKGSVMIMADLLRQIKYPAESTLWRFLLMGLQPQVPVMLKS